MTTFLLIRHASFDGVGRIIVGRTPGVTLNDLGRREAERLAEVLSRGRIDAMYSSPLERARETASVIASRLPGGLDVRGEPGLLELDWGEWTGKSLDELRPDPVFQRFNLERETTRIPGGELMLEAQARALRAIREIAESEPREARVAVVSHADIIRAILVDCLGAPIDRLLRFQLAPASVSVMDVTGDYRSIRAVNVPADVVETFS